MPGYAPLAHADARDAIVGSRAAAAPPIIARMLGITNAMVVIVLGMVNAVGDALGADAPKLVAKVSVGLGLVSAVFSLPLIYSDSISEYDWAEYGVGAVATLLGVLGLSVVGLDDDDSEMLSFLLAILSAVQLTVTIYAFIKDAQTDPTSDVGFAAGITATLPGMINPVKYLPKPAALVVAVVDGVGGFVIGALDLWVVLAETEVPAPRRRLFFPFVPVRP